jgi:serine-type D-Ala-D-Ala carboxypeptidase/endopeptidase
MKIKTQYQPNSWTPVQWVVFIIVLILLLLLAVGMKGQNVPYDRAFIDKKATEYINNKNNRALVIGIIKDGQKEVFTYGETEKNSKIKPDKNAIFEIGQMSEVFTTSLLAVLESKGKVSSHEAVQDILKGIVKVPYYQRVICQKYPTDYPQTDGFQPPKTVCFPDPNDMPQMMVLCDLATHSSGLPEEPSMSLFLGKNPYKDFTLDKLNQFVNRQPPNQSFGYEYQHSLVGVGLLGEALSFKMKKDYPTLLKDEILTPLSMAHTFTTPTPEQATLFLTGHTTKGTPTPHRDYNALTPAAGIRTNVPNLLSFIEANISDKIALNLALRETHIPRIFTDLRTPQYMMGWGWIQAPLDERDDKNKKKMLWQCGERGGFASFMAFVKDGGTAVVVLSNTANSVDELGHEILKNLDNTPNKIKTASVEMFKN